MGTGSPTVRGVVVLGVREWLERTHGPSGRAEILESLSPSARDAVAGRALIQTTRVDAVSFRAFGEAIISRWGVEGPKGFRSAAAYVAESDLNGYMKVLMKLGTPGFVLRRFPRVWGHYFDTGTLSVETEGNGAEVEIVGAQAYGAAALEGAAGWMRKGLELSGASGSTVERSGPDTRAHYRLTWT